MLSFKCGSSTAGLSNSLQLTQEWERPLRSAPGPLPTQGPVAPPFLQVTDGSGGGFHSCSLLRQKEACNFDASRRQDLVFPRAWLVRTLLLLSYSAFLPTVRPCNIL